MQRDEEVAALRGLDQVFHRRRRRAHVEEGIDDADEQAAAAK
jgi:hypothetical protein